MESIFCEVKHEPEYIISEDEDSRNLTIAEETTEIFKCSNCGKEFAYANQLKYHNKLHAFPKRKKYVRINFKDFFKIDHFTKVSECKICGQAFTLCNIAADHIAVHIRNERAKCSYCEKQFSTRSSKVKHEKIHERKQGI